MVTIATINKRPSYLPDGANVHPYLIHVSSAPQDSILVNYSGFCSSCWLRLWQTNTQTTEHRG